MSERIKGVWMVMDGRATFDTDAASIFEVLCIGVRDQVPRKAASKAWSGYDAHLVFCANTGERDPKTGAEIVSPGEYVEPVR